MTKAGVPRGGRDNMESRLTGWKHIIKMTFTTTLKQQRTSVKVKGHLTKMMNSNCNRIIFSKLRRREDFF